jgi:hypothetical protein
MSYPLGAGFIIVIVQFAVAVSIASVSMIGYRMFGSRTLFRMALSFYLVGVGLLAQGVGSTGLGVNTLDIFLFTLGLYVEASGYFVLAISHVYTVRSEIGSTIEYGGYIIPLMILASQPSFAFLVQGVARSISFFLLLYILGESLIFFAKNRNGEALLPIAGFFLLVVAVFVRLFLVLPTETSDLVDILKLVGFLILSGPLFVLLARLRGGAP